MKRINLDGKVICEVMAPQNISTDERSELIARVRRRAKLAREQNAGVAPQIIQREIQRAIDEVRRQKNSCQKS